MPDIFATIAGQRAALLAGEESARFAVARAYTAALRAVMRDIDRALLAEDARPSRLAFLLAELDRVSAPLSNFVAQASGDIASEQARQVIAASGDARETILRVVDIADLPRVRIDPADTDALSNIVGAAGRGTPLESLLQERIVGSGLFGPSVMSQAKAALTTAVLRGQGAQEASRTLRRALGSGQWVAERIARTEVIRAYREASRQSYLENSDVVSGWRWLSTHTARTCAACLAMDGRVFPSTVPMGTHPACRCVQVPVVIGAEGVTTAQTGEEWLRDQDRETQEEILTPRGRAMWASGKVALSDFVRESYSPQWGVTRTARVPREAQASRRAA